MAVAGRIVGSDGVAAAYGNGSGIPCPQLSGQPIGKRIHFRLVRLVGTARTQCAGEAVLAHERPAADTGKATRRQQLGQLHQRIIVIAVAEQHHRHSQRTAAADHIPQIGHQQIRHTARVGGTAHHRQLTGRDGQHLLPGGGQGVIVFLIGRVQRVRQPAGDAGDVFFRRSRGAEPDGVYPDRQHSIPSVQISKSSDFSLSVSSLTGRGGTRRRGS